MNSTIYDVSVRYGLDDKASAALENLGRTAERTERSVGGLKEGLRTLAEVFLVKEGLHAAKEWFVDSNSEMEQMKINLAAISSYNMGKPFAEAADQTDRLIAGWQEFSKSTTLTTTQFTDFGSKIEGAVLSAGASMKEFDQIVRRGAVVGDILGAGHAGGLQFAATEAREALMGQVRKTQMLNVQLLGPVLKHEKKTLEEWNTMTSQERIRLYMAAINDPSWDEAIKRQSGSYKGRMSTLKDNLEILGRDIGDKFTKRIEAGLGDINKWISTHPKEIAEFTTKISDGLAKAFDMMKGAFGFIVEHKDLLLRLAEAWAVSKAYGAFGGAGGMLGMLPGAGGAGIMQNLRFLSTPGAFGGGQMNAMGGFSAGAMAKGGLLGSAINSMFDSGSGLGGWYGALGKASEGLKVFEGALAGLPGPLGLVGAGLLAFHAALQAVAQAVDDSHKTRVEHEADFRRLHDYALVAKGSVNGVTETGSQNIQSRTLLKAMRDMGLVSDQGMFDRTKARAHLELLANQSEESNKNLKDVPRIVASMEALMGYLGHDEIMKRLKLGGSDKPTDVTNGKKKDRPNQNITIQKIEVPASDPDRFVHQLVRKFDRVSKNPGAADRVLRGGF